MNGKPSPTNMYLFNGKYYIYLLKIKRKKKKKKIKIKH